MLFTALTHVNQCTSGRLKLNKLLEFNLANTKQRRSKRAHEMISMWTEIKSCIANQYQFFKVMQPVIVTQQEKWRVLSVQPESGSKVEAFRCFLVGLQSLVSVGVRFSDQVGSSCLRSEITCCCSGRKRSPQRLNICFSLIRHVQIVKAQVELQR